MAAVDIFDVKVLDNPAPFTNPLQFEITYDVRETLKEDIEWKVIYVGCAEDESHDQELDAVLLPADNTGRFMFVLQVEPPNPSLIPDSDVLGVTIVLLTCSYNSAEFIRVGYYVSNQYTDPDLHENPPSKPLINKIQRTVAAHEPRVTKFPHKFDFCQVKTGTPAEPELSTDGSHFAAEVGRQTNVA
eukprot:gb/GEZJ01003193.1/.p2 GENE.gb/GEZJ01003193.1/~~gb/GEZJ01003193.1/.p2  ORF type:complete len:187 (-),score=26.43 gb/GEZJ01003193.1/:1486-2046(-)